MELDPSSIFEPCYRSTYVEIRVYKVLQPQLGPDTQPNPGPRKWETFAGTSSNVLSIYLLFAIMYLKA